MCELRFRNRELQELVYAASSSIHGTGLFAGRAIGAGDYIGTYWGPEAKRNGMYVLWMYAEDYAAEMVGRCGRNLLRYLNHSKNGNCEFYDFDLYATEHIIKGTEITFDYGDDFFVD